MRVLIGAVLLSLASAMFGFDASPSFISYEKGVFEKAQIKAAEEGKLLFLDFYANWCTPCKWMDETTFADPGVLSKLNEKYVAIKINIDDFEGFELKSKFDVRYLPTILIFNTEGKMVERIEETLSPSKMSNVLDKYDRSSPNSTVKHGFNLSPHEVASQLSTEEPSTTIGHNSSIVDQDKTSGQASSSKVENPSSFRMQMGVFSTAEGANKKVSELQEIFLEDMAIIEDDRTGIKLYKVVMGNFTAMDAAESFRKILKEKYHMDSIIF